MTVPSYNPSESHERRIAALERDFAVQKEQLRAITATLEAMIPLPMGLAKVSLSQDQTAANVAKIIERFDKGDREREQEAKDRESNRSSDRRWQVGTALTTVGLILAALGLFGDSI